MTFRALLAGCWFTHARDPLIVMDGTIARFECRQCQADLGPVLVGQRYRARRVKKAKHKLTVPADVVPMKKRSA